jgi:hypothetical protein
MATISNTPRPGYAWDATDNCWYPIGTGPHTHADYITSSSAINPTIVDAKGDIIAATAADTVARLAVGANNTVLTADSSTATGLKWATPAGGKVLQVVMGTTTTSTNISSTTFTDTTLTASITPTATTSKVLVMFSQVSSTARNAIESGSGTRLLRGATAIYEPGAAGYETQYVYGTGIGTSGTNIKGIVTGMYLDSPATTSATTYKTQARTQNSTSSPSVQLNDGISTIILMEIGA